MRHIGVCARVCVCVCVCVCVSARATLCLQSLLRDSVATDDVEGQTMSEKKDNGKMEESAAKRFRE